MRKTGAIFFDFDGVIVDSVDIKTSAFVSLYADCDPGIGDAVRAYHLAHTGTSRYEKIRYFQRELVHGAYDDTTVASLGDRFATEVKSRVIGACEIAGATSALERLSQVMPLFLASATPQVELREIVAARQLQSYFTGVYGVPRTKREILSSEISKHGLDPAKCFMIGDAMSDYDAANDNSISFIGIVPRRARNPFPAGTEIMNDLTELPSRILI